MTEMETPSELAMMLETLTDWFETIEEVELADGDRQLLSDVAESLIASKEAAIEMGFPPEDFEEWLHLNVLEQWSSLIEDMDDADMPHPIQSFHDFAKGGEQRLYLQMLKGCSMIAESQTA